jgi:hypothetical protein
LEALVSAANNDATRQERYICALEGHPSPDISFEDEPCIGKADSGFRTI